MKKNKNYLDFYAQISEPFREAPELLKVLKLCNKILTIGGYIAYAGLLFGYAKKEGWRSKELPLLQSRLLRNILIPGITFVLLSFFRRGLNAKRPYEQFPIEPLMKKKRQGRSFPSRHVFSMLLIAGCWYGLCPAVGVILTLGGIILALIRVVGGVHFPKDVAVGGVVGFLLGLLTAR